MHHTLQYFDLRFSAILTALISTYFVPAWVYILLCIFLVLTDSFFGLLSIRERGDKFSFRKLIFNGIILKFAVYFPVIVGAVKLNELFLEPIFRTNIPLLISLIFIFTYDIRSIWGHFKIIRGGGSKKDMSALSGFFDWLREIITKIQDK